MDIDLSSEQRQLQDAAKRFAKEMYGFERRRTIFRSKEGFEVQNWKAFSQMGFLSLIVPEEYGGLERGALDCALVMAELGPALLIEPLAEVAFAATAFLIQIGNLDVNKVLLPQMASGELIVVIADQEAPARGEPGEVASRAVQDGGHWILFGHKSVVMGAPSADELLVTARVEDPVPTRREGVAVFRVPRDTPGLKLMECVTIDGRRAADISLDGVRLKDEARISLSEDATGALRRAIAMLQVVQCAEAVGIMHALLNATVEYLKTRIQFGQPLSRFQVLQHEAADMLVNLEQARSMMFSAALHVGGGDGDQGERTLSAAKVISCDAGRRISQSAVQLHGGMGLTDELPVSHWFKRLLAIEIAFGGTSANLKRFIQLSKKVAS